MIEPTYHAFKYQSPASTINLLNYCYGEQETYNDHVETLRRLLTFIQAKAIGCDHAGGLWEIKPKKAKKLNKLLQSLDDLLLEVKADNG